MLEFNYTKGMTLEDIKQRVNDYLKTAEAKKEAKESIVKFFNDEDSCGYFQLGYEFDVMGFSDEDWKEVAKKVGEDICVQGDLVYMRCAILPSELETKWFRA